MEKRRRERKREKEREGDHNAEIEAEERTNERASERTNERTNGGTSVVLRRGGKEEAVGAFDLGRGRRQSVRPLSFNSELSRGRVSESGDRVFNGRKKE